MSDIEKRTDVRKSAVGRIEEVMNTDQENNFDGCSSTLSAHDKHSPVIKFNQEGCILLFRLLILLIPPLYTLYIPKWSERHFGGVLFGLSQSKK